MVERERDSWQRDFLVWNFHGAVDPVFAVFGTVRICVH